MSSATRSPRTAARRDEPRRLEESAEDGQRLLTTEECDAIFARATALAKGGGDTQVSISSWWQGELRWARNRVSLASDRRNDTVTVVRTIRNGATASATTNQLDDVSLEATVRSAERISGFGSKMGRGVGFYPKLPYYQRPPGAIWSDATYDLTTESRGEVARSLIAPAEAKGMLSAGYLEVRACSSTFLGTAAPELRTSEHAFWETPYVSWTQAQCSTTVRDPRGTGSGWAGLSSFDWGTIDSEALGARALE